MMIPSYTRYMMRLLLGPLVIIAAALTSIIWLTRALRFVDFIINRGLSLGDFIYITSLLLPSLLLILLPVALAIATIVTYQRLAAESELVVLRAAGVSQLQLARPLLIVGSGVAAVCYLISLYVLPVANRQFNDMRTYIRDNYASVLLQEEVFNTPVDGLTVFIRERDDEGNLRGILVHDSREGQTAITMMAEQGKLLSTPEGPRFYLVKGQRQERQDGRISWLDFDEYTLDISFYTGVMHERKRDPDEEFVQDLLNPDFSPRYSPTEQAQRFSEAHRRLSWPLQALSASMLAVGMLFYAAYNRRSQWKANVMAAGAVATSIAGAIMLSNFVVETPAAMPLMYIWPVIVFATGLVAMWRPFASTCPPNASAGGVL